MKKNLILRVFFTIIIFFVLILFFKLNIKDTTIQDKTEMINEKVESSNIIKDVSYISKDSKGNEYKLEAAEGVIDQNESNYIFLTTVKGSISLSEYNLIEISSDSGKYNINNYDTIFSKNVIISYLYNKIISEYLDFSFERNSMIISKNVKYTNLKNTLEADVIEMDIKTKDAKIYMYEDKKKVNIKNIK